MGAPVILNVYDLHDNSWIYWCGIGEPATPRGAIKGTLFCLSRAPSQAELLVSTGVVAM